MKGIKIMKSASTRIKKLDNISLENVSGGKLFEGNVQTYLQKGGVITGAIGMFGYGACIIASSCFKNRNAKLAEYFNIAGDVCFSTMVLGGVAAIGSKL